MKRQINVLDCLEVPNGFQICPAIAHVMANCLCLCEKLSNLRPKPQSFNRGKIRARERLDDDLLDRDRNFCLFNDYGAPIWHRQIRPSPERDISERMRWIGPRLFNPTPFEAFRYPEHFRRVPEAGAINFDMPVTRSRKE
ncbi:hypothetical protein [Ensifer sp.]|uniref:hypothetical protein n=1 Tax=Ensifer sp. TaxID=1872086 RepID=UPI0028997A81|nr:hypothetical protein [Ensifer sp.]